MEVDLQKLKAAAEAAHPAGWSQGRLLSTPQTRRWTDEEQERMDKAERRRVFRSFTVADSGRARQLVAVLDRPEDAAFVAAASPSVVLALIAEIERITKACEAHGHALQLAAQAAGLFAGADMHRDLVPAIERLQHLRLAQLKDHMGLKIVHEGSVNGWPQENCCMCRKKTPWWYGKGPLNVALCPDCAKTTRKSEVPTKAEWFKKERALKPPLNNG